MEANQNKLQVQAIQTQEIYQGPIPHPEVLKKFQEVDPSYPERLMVMAEENNRAAIRREDKIIGLKTLGQVLSFTLGLAGFVLAAVFGLHGAETGAIASLLAGISPVIIAALANLKK